jgi:hypothetical protein
MVQRVAESARIPQHISPDSLRRAAVTNALDAGVPLRDAQILARHHTVPVEVAAGAVVVLGGAWVGHFLTACVAGV